MLQVKHPNIISKSIFIMEGLKSVIETENEFYFICDYGETNLKEIISKKKKLSESDAIKIIHDVTKGYNFLKEKLILNFYKK